MKFKQVVLLNLFSKAGTDNLEKGKLIDRYSFLGIPADKD